MELRAVMDELGSALGTIDGLRVYPHLVGSLAGKTPAGLVLFPEQITYHRTMARGADSMRVPVLVVVGRADDRAATDSLAGYLDGSGSKSVLAAIEGHDSDGVWDSATVVSAEAGADKDSAGAIYLAAIFQIDVFGAGGS